MEKKKIILSLICAVVLLTNIGCNCQSSKSVKEKVGVGVYDSRAVAIAYVHSDILKKEMEIKMAEMKKAKAEGDTKKIKELEKWGQSHQANIHRQGFSTAPVDDLLKHVEDKLPKVMEDANVTALVSKWDEKMLKHYKQAEQVDVTDEMAALFNPNEKALEAIEQLKDEKPIPLWKLETMMLFEKH